MRRRAARSTCDVDILMFHSISHGPGPLSIPPATFDRQMAILEATGRHGVALSTYVAWRRGEIPLEEGPVVLTFDDGYADFASAALPQLQARGWGATLFLPTDRIGEGAAADRGRPVVAPLVSHLDWPTVRHLAAQGIELGAHGRSHADLTRLPLEEARIEIEGSKLEIERRTGSPVESFAAPFGRVTRPLLQVITEHYRSAVGTRLGRAADSSCLFDLPRVEMWYFRSPRRWRDYLDNGPGSYFFLRQLLRRLRRFGASG